MIPFFETLGRRIESAWRKCSYNEDSFFKLVAEILDQEPPVKSVTIEDIVDWTFGPLHPFLQPDSTGKLFGEPPVVLFQAPRFYIEALFWLSGTTDIHEHAFSGAFTVLSGTSVHSHWRFLSDHIVNSRMAFGRLERVSTEILHPGDIRPIHPGQQLIHQLFHLEVPSVTIVVRTYQDKNHLPQFKYLLPGLAIDTENVGNLLTRRLIFLSGMARQQIKGLEVHAIEMTKNVDLESLYYMLALLSRHQVSTDLMNNIYDFACQRHGNDVIDLFRSVCEGERRTRTVVKLRSKISDPDVRFLLALLMLMPDRAAVFEALQVEAPDTEPLAAIESWVGSIPSREIGFDFNDVNRLIFRGLVEGLDMDGLLQRLRTEYSRESLDAQGDRLLVHIKRVANSDLFFPLFSESPIRG
jgi:hypothetical protein